MNVLRQLVVFFGIEKIKVCFQLKYQRVNGEFRQVCSTIRFWYTCIFSKRRIIAVLSINFCWNVICYQNSFLMPNLTEDNAIKKMALITEKAFSDTRSFSKQPFAWAWGVSLYPLNGFQFRALDNILTRLSRHQHRKGQVVLEHSKVPLQQWMNWFY